MSADIINLRQARKAKARAERERQAAEHRARYGRTRADREHRAAISVLDAARLDGAKITHTQGRKPQEPPFTS